MTRLQGRPQSSLSHMSVLLQNAVLTTWPWIPSALGMFLQNAVPVTSLQSLSAWALGLSLGQCFRSHTTSCCHPSTGKDCASHTSPRRGATPSLHSGLHFTHNKHKALEEPHINCKIPEPRSWSSMDRTWSTLTSFTELCLGQCFANL